MKKLSYLYILIGAIGFASCTKNLNQTPVSSIQTVNFYSNTNDFKQAVNGVYSQLKAYPGQALWMGEMRSDNMIGASDGNRDWQGINDFSPNLTTTAFVVAAWNNNFNGVYNANTVLNALSTKSANISDTALVRRFNAECRYLRAFYYFQLLRLYGPLPIVNKVMTPAELATIPRSPVKDVYDFIVQDLQFASSNLPASYAAAEVGKATSYAAKALLGLVYITKSGPVYGGVNGPTLASNEYNLALAQFNDIINSAQFQLLPSYPSVFAYTNENNKEVIFDVQFMSTSNATDYPSQTVPPAFWSGQGLSGYDNGYGTGSFNTPTDLMTSYRISAGVGKTDIRDTFNIKHGWPRVVATPLVLDTTAPFIKKYVDVVRRGVSRSDWPINFIFSRYADILLMKAECILHGATGTQADVDALVNQVRIRAGLSSLTNVDLPALMEERRREFLGEGLRWNDLIREGMAVTTMNNWITINNIKTINTVKPQFIIYPIPQAEILAQPGLYTQNDGYQ